jgi:hypothetical protein
MFYPDYAQTAIDCFDENQKLFAPAPGQDLEKFNFYQGLRALAKATKQTQQALTQIKLELEQIKKQTQA